MKILGIETSCDETGVAIVDVKSEHDISILSNSLATSMNFHAETGGIIPEIAARHQSTYMLPVLFDALTKAGLAENRTPDIHAIAVTYGPGLIGSLLVGVETAKTLSYLWNKPLIPVNHLFGHLYANWIGQKKILFPAIALIVSGGHTDLLLMKSHDDITWLGGTRDDAAGEAFDKIGRLLGFPYPAGPLIELFAKNGDPHKYTFPRPLMSNGLYDFSFSGLKTAVLREVQKTHIITEDVRANICRGMQDAIISVLVKKTLRAIKTFHAKSLILSGGVASNQTLRTAFHDSLQELNFSSTLYVPEKSLCTDNAAMIATAGYFTKEQGDWKHTVANPQLYFD